jgi:hypothetical protein
MATSLAGTNKDELPNHKQRCESEREHAFLQSEPKNIQEVFFEKAAPCQLATQLASNGNADIARSAFDVDVDGSIESNEVDGVECSKAYQMLARFATTEDKLNVVARALEDGCSSVDGKKGRCKVKKEYIWKALDDVMD